MNISNFISNLYSKVGLDKITHFLACYALTLTVGMRTDWITGMALGIIVGVLKEYYDLVIGKGRFDWKDLLADAIGVAFGVLMVLF